MNSTSHRRPFIVGAVSLRIADAIERAAGTATAREIATEIGCDVSSVHNVARKLGASLTSNADRLRARILAHPALGIKPDRVVAEAVGCNAKVVGDVRRTAGTPPRRRWSKADDTRDAIVRVVATATDDAPATASTVARATGYSRSVVTRQLLALLSEGRVVTLDGVRRGIVTQWVPA